MKKTLHRTMAKPIKRQTLSLPRIFVHSLTCRKRLMCCGTCSNLIPHPRDVRHEFVSFFQQESPERLCHA